MVASGTTRSREEQIYGAIRAAGGRLTGPTRAVVGVLVGSDRHLTADDLIAEIDRGYPGIAPSTIYRVLMRLDELGIVEHVHSGTSPAFYHLRERGHAHLVCNSCGRIIDIPDSMFSQLAQTVEQAYAFAVEPRHAAILGRCAACRS